MSSPRCPRSWEASALRDGRLPASAQVRFEQHCVGCEPCQHAAEGVRALSDKLRGAEPALDEMASRRLRHRILRSAHEGPAQLRARSRGWARRIASAVAVGTLAALSGALMDHLRHPVLPAAEQLAPHDRALVGPQQSVLVPPPPAVSLVVSESAGAQWHREAQAGVDRVALLEGSLTLEVHHSADHAGAAGRVPPPIVVQLPDGQIRDLGTRFRVVVQQGRTREITVFEGSVLFERPGRSEVRVEQGSTWHAELEPPSPVSAVRARQHDTSRPEATNARSAAVERLDDHDAEDAAYLRWISLLRAGRRDAARAAGLDYLRRFPHGFRHSEVERAVRPSLGGSSSP